MQQAQPPTPDGEQSADRDPHDKDEVDQHDELEHHSTTGVM
jgi:hypothetical protein